MMKNYLILSLLILTILLFHSAYGDDDCSDKLLSPDIRINVDENKHLAFLHDTMCKLDFQAFNKQWGASASGYYLAAGGSGSYNENTYRQTQQNLCTSEQRLNADSSLAYHATSIIPPSARHEYVMCKQRQPVSCIAEPRGDSLVIKMYLNPDSNGLIRASTLSVRNGPGGATASDIKAGDDLWRGPRDLNFDNYQPNQNFSFSMNIVQQDVGNRFKNLTACSVFIPKEVLMPLPPPPPPLPSCRGPRTLVYGQSNAPPVFNNNVTKYYQFINLGPGILRVYPNNAKCTVPVPPNSSVKTLINNGPTNLRVDQNNMVATAHYYEVDSGQTVDDKCSGQFIYDNPPLLCTDSN